MKKLLFLLAFVPFLVNAQTPAALVDLSVYHDDDKIMDMVDENFSDITDGTYKVTASATSGLVVDGTFNFAADGQANDDYEIDIPHITALTTGLMVIFTATTANTDGATLEITGIGDLDAILKTHDVALATNDIEAGSVVIVVFDGSNWQMIQPPAN